MIGVAANHHVGIANPATGLGPSHQGRRWLQRRMDCPRRGSLISRTQKASWQAAAVVAVALLRRVVKNPWPPTQGPERPLVLRCPRGPAPTGLSIVQAVAQLMRNGQSRVSAVRRPTMDPQGRLVAHPRMLRERPDTRSERGQKRRREDQEGSRRHSRGCLHRHRDAGCSVHFLWLGFSYVLDFHV